MDLLKIENIECSKNHISFNYTKGGKWNELLSDKNFFVEYDINIESVPNSILIIPLICNVLPISWVFDLEIELDELDKDFFNCIEDIKKGYQGMFPSIKMAGNIKVNKLVKNKYTAEKAGALFSGGVDAFNTLVQHIEEKPVLLTVWGADVKLADLEGWDRVKQHHIKTAKKFDLTNSFVKSNLRTFYEYESLSEYVRKYVDDEWWHGFQHGIALLGLMSPVAYVMKFSKIYIASSFTAAYKGKYTCASDPTIDNYLKFANCGVIHDGYELNRQDKIRNICNYFKKSKVDNIPVRVCWQSNGGENCCKCEKCTRTILGILAEKNDPSKFGFNFDDNSRKNLQRKIIRYAKYSSSRYSCIQNRFRENYTEEETPKYLKKFRNLKINEKKPKYLKFFEKTYNILKKIKP